jgi:hypothetical protein
MRRWLAPGLLALLLATGCSGKVIPTGGLMVVMSQDHTLQPDRLHVHIASADGTKPYRDEDWSIPSQASLPTTIAIASNGDPSAAVLVDVSVWSGTKALDDRQITVIEIPTTQVAELDVVFSGNCTKQTTMMNGRAASLCTPEGKTCDPTTGNCTGNNQVNAKDLPLYSGDAGAPATEGGSSAEDAGPDTTLADTGSDAADSTLTDAPTGAESGPPEGSSGDTEAGGPPADATTDTASTMDAPADATVDAADASTVPDGGDPDIDYSVAPVTLTMAPFTVPAGQEIFECQTFANPWGRAVDVKIYSVTMGSGGFGLFAFYAPNATSTAVAACTNGAHTWGQFTFSAQNASTTLHYPTGVGANIAATTGFQLMAHYVNAGSTTAVAGSAAVTMSVAKPGLVTSYAGVLFLNQNGINVPPCPGGCQQPALYTLPQAVNIVQTDSIMDHYGNNFTATASTGPTIHQTTAFTQPPPTVDSPALAIPADAGITWTCTHNNSTGSSLTYNGMVITGGMCAMASAIYPIADPANPVVGGSL